MYGRCGKLIAQTGQRAALIAILNRAADLVGGLAGCRAYLVSEDRADDVGIWVFELWVDKAAHGASLQDERVRALIAEARPLIGGMGEGAELNVVGGYGLENSA